MGVQLERSSQAAADSPCHQTVVVYNHSSSGQAEMEESQRPCQASLSPAARIATEQASWVASDHAVTRKVVELSPHVNHMAEL